MPFDRGNLRRGPHDPRTPPLRILEVPAREVVRGQLLAGGPGVGERALGQDPLVDAGVGVGHLLLHERAAGAAGADRVAQRAVPLDQVLLGHDQRLGLRDQVAVVPGVVERGGHHREPLAEGDGGAVAAEGVAGNARRGAALVVDRAARAVGDQQLVVELLLRRPGGPRLPGLEERRDLVLVTVLVAGLDPDDEGDRGAGLGGGRGDVVRRVLRVVRLESAAVRGHVLVLVGRLLVALRALRAVQAAPRLDLRAGEHRAAVCVVDDGETVGALAGDAGCELVLTNPEPCEERLEAAVRPDREPARHVGVAETDRDVRRLQAAWQVDRDERVAARDHVGPVGEDVDARSGLGERTRRGDSGGGDYGRQELESARSPGQRPVSFTYFL